MISIILADDHVLVRQSLARALADVKGFQVVGEASSAEQAIELVVHQHPQVVLMDISMPVVGGLAATETIRKAHPQVKVLILTIHDREDYLFKAFRAGASGYILKDAGLEELIEAIQAVVRGDIYIYPCMAYKLVKDYFQLAQGGASKTDGLKALTSREEEVLHLVAEGRRTKEIAQTLNLSPRTVSHHLDHVMEKLKLHSRAELISFAIRRGILEESD